jgi:hypothetical protein
MINIDLYEFWILDSTLTKVAKISLLPINSTTLVKFSRELDDYGQATFRMSALDPILEEKGDILSPHQYWFQIIKSGTIVWQGAIIENTKRSREFIECVAVEPLWYLSRILVQRTSADPSGAGPSTTATAFSMSGSTATMSVNSYPSGAVPTVNGSVNLSGFSPTAINGTWLITSVSGTSFNVTIPGGPYSASTIGQVLFTDGIYRIFGDGYTTPEQLGITMSTAVTNIMNETIATFQANDANHPLANLALGTVQNPNYPPNTTNAESTPATLTGGWYFGDGVNAPQLMFDFHNILYIIQQFGVYSYSDFYIDNNLNFNFVNFKGNNLSSQVNFSFSPGGVGTTPGNIVDYNIPRLGQRQINDLVGIATDINGNILNYPQSDAASITQYGYLQDVAAYTDVKDQATLNARIQAELPLVSTPDDAAITIQQSESGYPFGTYDVGDIVSIDIQNKGVSFQDQRRIVGITVTLDSTGREMISVQTNKLLSFQPALASGQGYTSVTT